MPNLEDLVLQAQLGDKQAYAALYARFRDMALAYSLSIVGDYDLAEDARQEAFIDAYCDILSLRNPKAFPGWFRKIVFNTSVDAVKRRGMRSVSLDEAQHIASNDSSASEKISREEEKKRMEAAIRRLPQLEREVTKLFYLESKTLREISLALEVPVKTVKSKLHFARARLRQMLMGRAKKKIHQSSSDEKKKILAPASKEAIGQFEKELQMILSHADGGQNRIADLICGQARLYRFLGQNEDALAALRRGLSLPFVATNASIQARLQTEVGLTYIQTSDYSRAKKEFRQSRGLIPDEPQNQATLAAVLNGLGICAWGEGAFRKAREFYSESLRIGKGRMSEILAAEAHNNLALLEWKDGRLTAALRHLDSCLRMWRKANCPYGTALTQMNLGIVEENLGHYIKAEKHYQTALDSARQYDFIQVQAATQTNLANLAIQQQRWKQALANSKAALELSQKIQDRRSEAIALENIALTYLGLGDKDQGTQALDRGRKIARAIGDKERLFSLELVEIEGLFERNAPDAILKKIAGLQKKLGVLGYRAELPRLLGLRGRAEHLANLPVRSKRTFSQAIALSRKQKNRAAEHKIQALAAMCKTQSAVENRSKTGGGNEIDRI